LLAAALLATLPLFQATVNQWFQRAPSTDLLNLIRGLAQDPFLLALWLGPVVWLGVALFEELSRAFFLIRFQNIWGTTTGRWIAILASAFIWGFAHIYQGPAGVISISLLGILKGWIYLRFGRLWVLVVAHALYDSVQIGYIVWLIRSGAFPTG
jgi:membrane protease YdiL (CAAX protease family)